MKRPIIIAIVGLPGAGKSEATACFLKSGFAKVGFNDVFYDEFDRRGIQRVEELERPVREEMRKEFGMNVAAIRSLSKIEKLLSEKKNIVIESLYSWSEYKTVKERYYDWFKVLAIYAPPELRYKRLKTRDTRPLTEQEAQKRDYAQIENLEQAQPIVMADWTIKNLENKQEFIKEVEDLIEKII